MQSLHDSVLIIACGALAREINALVEQHHWQHVKLQCIDARLHNRPALIPQRVAEKIRQNRDKFDRIFVAYADCGTGGAIDRVLEAEGVERLPGAHCYQFYAGKDRFAALSEAEPGTFYLTDFLARNFDRLVMRPLKLDRHPELRDAYFGNYRKLVYLSQTLDDELKNSAKLAAQQLRLPFEHLHCGYGGLERGLVAFAAEQSHGQENTRLLA
ncbi:MAG: DUF1638 domain-containing protein [Woeseiaceae bacterium]|nr:DUF1638 domain-containing protein [Woeseiaceae bacterium]